MGDLLRVLVDKSYHDLNDASAKCSPDNLRGDAATNFKVEQQRISFYRVESADDTFEVVLAIATTRKSLDDVSYCVVPEASVIASGVNLDTDVLGETLIERANKMHVDITDVTLARLVVLVTNCVESGACEMIRSPRVREALAPRVANGEIPREKLQDQLRREIDDWIQKQAQAEARLARKRENDRLRAAGAPDNSAS